MTSGGRQTLHVLNMSGEGTVAISDGWMLRLDVADSRFGERAERFIDGLKEDVNSQSERRGWEGDELCMCVCEGVFMLGGDWRRPPLRKTRERSINWDCLQLHQSPVRFFFLHFFQKFKFSVVCKVGVGTKSASYNVIFHGRLLRTGPTVSNCTFGPLPLSSHHSF